VGSMTDFKQIIGRGTRVREDYGKLFFTILDYTGTATQNFADPAFDGDPVRATVETMDEAGQVESMEELPVPDQEDMEDGTDENAALDGQLTYVIEPGRLTQVRERQEPRKFYLASGVEVRIIHETVQQLDANGQKLRTVQLTDYTGEQVRTLSRNADDLRGQWQQSQQRRAILAALEERGIALEHVAEIVGQPEADPFDLMCHLAYSAPLRTRRERAERLRKEQRAFFAKYSAEARVILESVLDQYASYGPEELVLPDILTVPTVAQGRSERDIAALFGGRVQLAQAVTELQALLYAA
ncbi:MAG TPA: type I restriction-modification enzyme R subunit C-terminal domain-containing protein, partial [Ktedonobacterales bacterium]